MIERNERHYCDMCGEQIINYEKIGNEFAFKIYDNNSPLPYGVDPVPQPIVYREICKKCKDGVLSLFKK